MAQLDLFRNHGTELHDEYHCYWLVKVIPVVERSVRGICVKPYHGHPKGCPNFGKCDRCPPNVPFWRNVYGVDHQAYAVVNCHSIGAHIVKQRRKYPEWSEYQVRNCLHWQPRARAHLDKMIAHALKDSRCIGYQAEKTPEAMGINVTQTMKEAGVDLEWPPVNHARQVALLAKPRKEKCP